MFKQKVKLPTDAVLAVTYRCNARCVMCDIWQIKDYPELLPEVYRRLPRSLQDINISGGEPFLRSDLPQILREIKHACPKAKITISTNGFLVETIKKVLPELLRIDPKLGIAISLDGIGKAHEAVRRVPSAWAKVVQTINFCRSVLRMKNVKIAFTLNEMNTDQLQSAYEWSRHEGVQFTMAVAHSSDVYFGKKKNETHLVSPAVEKQFNFIIKKLLSSFHPKNWVRAFFTDGLRLIASGGKRPLQSFAGEDFFYLDPRGDVYPSVIDNDIMGNIFEFRNFVDLWRSSKAVKARKKIQAFENNYWMVCTARTAIRRNPLKVLAWVLKNKFTV